MSEELYKLFEPRLTKEAIGVCNEQDKDNEVFFLKRGVWMLLDLLLWSENQICKVWPDYWSRLHELTFLIRKLPLFIAPKITSCVRTQMMSVIWLAMWFSIKEKEWLSDSDIVSLIIDRLKYWANFSLSHLESLSKEWFPSNDEVFLTDKNWIRLDQFWFSKSNTIFFPWSGIERLQNFYEWLYNLQLIESLLQNWEGKQNLSLIMYHYYHGKWSKRQSAKRWENAYHIEYNPNYYDNEAEQFVEWVILPRIANIEKNEQGEPIFNWDRISITNKFNDIQEVACALRINLVWQSYWWTFIKMILNILNLYMKDLWYKSNEIRHLFSNIFILSLSWASPVISDNLGASLIVVDWPKDYVRLVNTAPALKPWQMKKINPNTRYCVLDVDNDAYIK